MLIPVYEDGRGGFIDQNSNLVVPIKYKSCFSGSTQRAGAADSNGTYLFDTRGTLVRNFDHIEELWYLGADRWSTIQRINGQRTCGMCDSEGKVLLDLGLVELSVFNCDRAGLLDGKVHWVIDPSGRRIFQEEQVVPAFHSNLIRINTGEKFEDGWGCCYKGLEGDIRIDGPIYNGEHFDGGAAAMRRGEMHQVLYPAGAKAFEVPQEKYDEVLWAGGGLVICVKRRAPDRWTYGVLNYRGEEVVPCIFDSIASGLGGCISDERIAAEIEGDCVYLDRHGNRVVKRSFDHAAPFKCGYGVVSPKGRHRHRVGLIDVDGNWVILPKYEELHHFESTVWLAFTEEGIDYFDAGKLIWTGEKSPRGGY
jgi:hypothetical protein